MGVGSVTFYDQHLSIVAFLQLNMSTNTYYLLQQTYECGYLFALKHTSIGPTTFLQPTHERDDFVALKHMTVDSLLVARARLEKGNMHKRASET